MASESDDAIQAIGNIVTKWVPKAGNQALEGLKKLGEHTTHFKETLDCTSVHESVEYTKDPVTGKVTWEATAGGQVSVLKTIETFFSGCKVEVTGKIEYQGTPIYPAK